MAFAIEIDEHGYPTVESLEVVREWDGPMHELPEFFQALADYFNDCHYGRAWKRRGFWFFATGGWSGCEDVIGAIPAIVDCLAWESSKRGGLHVYREKPV